MLWGGRNARAVRKEKLDVSDRHSVLLALDTIGVIPIESTNL